jgi:hypothetical protein
MNKRIIFLFFLVSIITNTIYGNNRMMLETQEKQELSNTLETISETTVILGMSMFLIGGADFIIDNSDSSLKLFQYGLGFAFIGMDLIPIYKQIEHLPKPDRNNKNISVISSMIVVGSTVYSIHSLSRDKSVLSVVQALLLFPAGNGRWSYDKEIAGIYCVSGIAMNIFIPESWDQPSVFIANISLLGIIMWLVPDKQEYIPKVSISPEQTTIAWNIDL